MEEARLVESTSEAALEVDLGGSILAWNEAAEEMHGYRRGEVLGRKCWKVLQGRDVYGNRYCLEHCPARHNAVRGEPMHRSQMIIRLAGGGELRVSDRCVTLRDASGSATGLVHVLRPAGPLDARHGGRATGPAGRENRIQLSDRQLEILRLLAEGKSTRAIAGLLGITVPTTRNHIQAIFTGLDVHSRLEAIALAHRVGLISLGRQDQGA